MLSQESSRSSSSRRAAECQAPMRPPLRIPRAGFAESSSACCGSLSSNGEGIAGGYHANVSASAVFSQDSRGFLDTVRTDVHHTMYVFDVFVCLVPVLDWASKLDRGVAYVHPAAMHEAFGVTMQQMAHLKRGHEWHPTEHRKGGRNLSEDRAEFETRSTEINDVFSGGMRGNFVIEWPDPGCGACCKELEVLEPMLPCYIKHLPYQSRLPPCEKYKQSYMVCPFDELRGATPCRLCCRDEVYCTDLDDIDSSG